ncbi:hypothetical protein B0H13DRAFT_336961 [Mycena leptocephala]|nr:hypothetical protein B0H13DRAFT_336961 [Mycena leptocephala]
MRLPMRTQPVLQQSIHVYEHVTSRSEVDKCPRPAVSARTCGPHRKSLSLVRNASSRPGLEPDVDHGAYAAISSLGLQIFPPVRFLEVLSVLPSLRFLELALRFVDRSTAWFFTIISDILAANSKSGSATIEELIVTYCPTESNGAAMVIPASLKSWSLRALENSLLSHRGSPRIRWRVGFMQVHRPEHFKKFTTFIRRAMPQLNRTGRLSFEQFEPDWDGYAGSFLVGNLRE